MKKILIQTITSVALSGSLFATEYSDLEAKVDALIEEIEASKAGTTDEELGGHHGHGDAMSKAYKKGGEKLSIGGYGHTDYVNNQGKDTDTANNYRTILYLGYKFSDKIVFNSEIEFEHANSIAMEFAAVDFMINDALNFRAGNFLIPVGNINLRHEPTLFLNVSRPETERQIIPSTWSENGIMVYGKNGNFEYTFAQTASLNAYDSTNSKAYTSIRSMRSGASKSEANDFAYMARLSYKPIEGLELITSAFTGEIDQGVASIDGAAITIAEAHILYNKDNINFTALYTQSNIDGAEKLSLSAADDVASETSGYYATLGYVMNQWTPFIHIESYDKFGAGFDSTGNTKTKDATTDVRAFGINYRPHKQVVIKADYMDQEVAGIPDDRFSMGVGYIF